MKEMTPEEEQDYTRALTRGALGYGAVGLALGLAGNSWLKKKYKMYAKYPVMARTAVVISAASAFCVFGAEKSTLAVNREYTGYNDYARQQKEEKKEATKNMTGLEKLREKFIENKYNIIGGGWALGVGLSSLIVWRDRFMNAQQKIVQVRVYAQTLTVVLILVAVAVSVAGQNSAAQRPPKKEHWQIAVEQEEKRSKELGIPTQLSRSNTGGHE